MSNALPWIRNQMGMRLIVGLGNPGEQYRLSRHNIGWLVLDQFSKKSRISLNKIRFKSHYGEGGVSGERVVLLKPLIYMNRSGEAVGMARRSLTLDMKDVIIVHDDLDMDFGRIRFKIKGGDGGHKGIRSAMDDLETDAFARLKFGIGRPASDLEASDYVLDEFTAEERDALQPRIDRAVDGLMTWVIRGMTVTMNRFNVEES
jgi:PTH1 family peptidyl-tRNA hydrolase